MSNILSYLAASAYSGISPLFSAASATCTLNGKPVPCSKWFIGLGVIPIFIIFALSILMIVSMWVIFKKAGKPGWAAIVPVYNIVIMLQIVNKPIWWIILYFIPFVNVIVSFIVIYNLASVFGKGIGFTLGLIFLPFIFYPILAFGKSTYRQNVQTAAPAEGPSSI